MHPLTPSPSSSPLYLASELPQSGGSPVGEVGGGQGGGGSELQVLERQWRGLGVGDAYWWRGEREAWRRFWGEGDAAMIRWWRTWWRSGERERRWRGFGMGHVYRWRGKREAWRHSVGEGDGDIGRWWRTWPRSGERERRERGPGELCRRLGEQERCEWGLGASEARWRRGRQESRGRECCAGEKKERCRLSERAPPWDESGHLGGVSGAWGAWRGGGGYWGGGGPVLSTDLPRRGVVLVEGGVAAVRFGIGFMRNNRFFSIISIKITNYSNYMT